MIGNAVDPTQTTAKWLYFRQFGEGYNPVAPPASEGEKLIAKLRQLQKELFRKEVKITKSRPKPANKAVAADPNPPQSLAEILQQRLEAQPLPSRPPKTSLRSAVKRGIAAGLAFLLLGGLVFLLKSLQ